MRNAQILMKSFLGSAPFTKWRKAGMLRLAKIIIRIEKRPYIVRRIWTTQGRYILSFLGVSQDTKLCPFDEFRGCERFPKTVGLFPLNGGFLALWICSGCWYNSTRNVVLLYQLFSFTRLLLVKSWSLIGDTDGNLL